MSKTWYPVINNEICIECGACINKCSHGVYDKESQMPNVISPEDCIEGCHGCGNLCPVGAIEYVGEIKLDNNCGCDCKEGGCL